MNPDQMYILYRMMEGQSIQQYRLEHLLGAGGFGGVFQAAEVVRDRVMRKLAIKLVSNTSDEQLDELNTAVSLDHPHFIRCFAAGECQILNAEFLFLVMELATGTLEQQLGQTAMAEELARQLIQDVATALRFLHQQNKVHRDLKPGNILFAQDRWKLSDFGLIRELGPQSYGQTSNPLGTIAFMPPEAFDGKISTAWDVWSLGIMTAGVMTGKLPYNYTDQAQLLKQVMTAQVQIPPLPEPFGAIVRGCLHTDFRQRWTAEQVLEALNPSPHPKPDPQPDKEIKTGFLGSVFQQVASSHPPTPSPQRVQGETNLRNQTFDLPNNGGQLALIAVPGGTLVMEGGHRVKLQPFYIGKYPITQRQYQAIMDTNPSRFKGNLECPVENITWHDAIAFCQELSKILKQKIDLPSETQWEWAARGATKSLGYDYGGSNIPDKVGWYWDNSGRTTHPVGQKKPNELGIYDMGGNVWEWCKDNWKNSINELPIDGTPLTNGGDSSLKALRGGSWFNLARNTRSDCRLRGSRDVRDIHVGFRVVLSP